MPVRYAGWRRASPCRDPAAPRRLLHSGRSWRGSRRPAPSSAQSSVPDWPSLLLRLSGRPRTSSQCLQHPLLLDALQAPLQKIDLQRLLTNLALQLRDPAFRPALLSVAREHIARTLTEFPPPAVQNVRVYLQRPRRFANGYPLFQPPHGG